MLSGFLVRKCQKIWSPSVVNRREKETENKALAGNKEIIEEERRGQR